MHVRSMRPVVFAGVLACACVEGATQQQREVSVQAEKKSADETQILKQINGLVDAVRSKDLERTMSFYSPDIVSFDLEPPLQYTNTKRWKQTFAAFEGPIGYEIRELSITGNNDLAFAHSLNRSSGTLKNGTRSETWVRWTACFRKLGGNWLIVHDHVSVPVDPATGKASMDLKP
jgi:ketosteroid isomerase-like protein